MSQDKNKGEKSSKRKMSSLESQIADMNEHFVAVMKTLQSQSSNDKSETSNTNQEEGNDPLKPPSYTQRNTKKARFSK